MSIQAMAWAIEQQEVREPETQLVLMCLANYAGADGKNAFPSMLRLVRDTRLSESTVRRHLRKLETMSLIRRGNQAIVAAQIVRADRRPTVYDLVVSPVDKSVDGMGERGVSGTPREGNGVSAEASRGVKTASTGCQSLTPDPKRTVRDPKSAITRDQKEEFKARVRLNALASTLSQSKRLGDGKR